MLKQREGQLVDSLIFDAWSTAEVIPMMMMKTARAPIHFA